jgi:hypothetical protein
MKFVFIACLCTVALVGVGCAEGSRLPTSPSATAGVLGLAASPRSGELHLTKTCGDFVTDFTCTVQTSNVKAIEAQSTILYLQPDQLGTQQGSNVVLTPPGPGSNAAYGNCSLATGVCTFSGGTGKFASFQARVDVTADENFVVWFWDGTYSFRPQD